MEVSRPLAGVDGCKGGWAVCLAHGSGIALRVYESMAELLDAQPDALVVVDMPIGLNEAPPGRRTCDMMAHKMLRPRRHCSVFSPPTRWHFQFEQYRDVPRQPRGHGIAAQAFGLLPKIKELDALLRAHPEHRERVFEAHPEISFAALAGCPLPHAKKKPEGSAGRLEVIQQHDPALHAALQERLHTRRPKVQPDDWIDAAVMSITARRIAAGDAQSLPDPPVHDAHGLPMTIWY